MKRIILLLAALAATSLAHAAPGGKKIDLSVAMAHPKMLADQRQIAHFKVGLTGFEMDKEKDRPAVNLALVLDRSGSMKGEKIVQARKAARIAVERLSKDDILSIVTYDTNVNVVVPATKLTDKASIIKKIEAIELGSDTALFGGVSKGAGEVRKFLSDTRVNRVILLSDGKANVGPSSPDALGELGRSLIKEGISVTTVGLGDSYNEDLMARLAEKSDGQHAYVQEPGDLVAIFEQDLGSAVSVVAQKIRVDITVEPGIVVESVLGRAAQIDGQKVSFDLNQIFSKEEKYALLEVTMPPTGDGVIRNVASVAVTYTNMATGNAETAKGSVDVSFTKSPELVTASMDKKVLEATYLQMATLSNCIAIEARDAGDIQKARQLFLSNEAWCLQNGGAIGSDVLLNYAGENRGDAENLKPGDWGERRKRRVQVNYDNISQQKIPNPVASPVPDPPVKTR